MKKNTHIFLLKNHQAGFTLVEVLIAIVLMTFVAITTLQITDSSISTKENVTKEDKELIQVLTLMNRLDADFSESYSPLYFDAKENPNLLNNNATMDTALLNSDVFEGNKNFNARTKSGFLIPNFTSEQKDSIIFLSTSHRRRMEGKKESRFVWIKYFTQNTKPSEDNEEKRAELELVRQAYASDTYTKDIDWSKVPEQIVLTNIKELEFQFWDERSKKYTTNINDLNENRLNIRSIKITFTWIDATKNEQYFEKSMRTLYPYFNPKQDDMLNTNANSANPFNSSTNKDSNIDGGEEL